jgi:hypothetical protein
MLKRRWSGYWLHCLRVCMCAYEYPQLDPSAQLYGELAFTLLRLGELDSAVEHAEHAISLSGAGATTRMKQVLCGGPPVVCSSSRLGGVRVYLFVPSPFPFSLPPLPSPPSSLSLPFPAPFPMLLIRAQTLAVALSAVAKRYLDSGQVGQFLVGTAHCSMGGGVAVCVFAVWKGPDSRPCWVGVFLPCRLLWRLKRTRKPSVQRSPMGECSIVPCALSRVTHLSKPWWVTSDGLGWCPPPHVPQTRS